MLRAPIEPRPSFLQLGNMGKAQEPFPLPPQLQLPMQSPQTLQYHTAALSSPGIMKKSCFSFLPIGMGALSTGKQKCKSSG